jgi:phosphoglucomutase/phosphomannomutase
LYQKRQGSTLLEYLSQIFREFGYVKTIMQPLVMKGILGKQRMTQMLNSLRTEPPRSLAGLAVTKFEDHWNEAGRFGPFKGETDRASRNVLVFELGERARAILRPSGTEPKAKAYIEANSAPSFGRNALSASQWERQCSEVDALASQIALDFVQLAESRST